MVRFKMCLLDFTIWFLIGSVSANVEMKSEIEAIYYFHVVVYNYVQTIALKYILKVFLHPYHLPTSAVLKN